jgi:hypothetical protein
MLAGDTAVKKTRKFRELSYLFRKALPMDNLYGNRRRKHFVLLALQ